MKDILLKNLPDSIEEEELFQWVSVLVNRKIDQEIREMPEVIAKRQEIESKLDSSISISKSILPPEKE